MERTTSITRTDLEEARFELGRIVNINPDRGTVDFRSQMSHQERIDIPYTMPYYDQYEGTGIYFNPEVGTTCICATTSDGLSMIVGWIGVDEKGSYLCGRLQGNPGDIAITGRDGNFIHIRRGGIVQIGSKLICQTVYIPTRNILQHFCENFELSSLAGSIKFSVDRAEDQSDGKLKCKYGFTVNEFADDKEPVLNIDAGALDSSQLFTLIAKNGSGGDTTISLKFDKQGNISLKTENEIKINSSGNISISTDGTLDINSNDTKVTSKQTTKIKGLDVDIDGTSNLKLNSDGITTIQGSSIKIGQGLFPVLRLSPDMATFLAALSALVAASGVNPPINHVDPTVLV